MTGATIIAGAVQLAGIALAPLLAGAIQQHKARLQGRVGTSALQPYRDLRRLWGKAVVQPLGTTIVYVLAPAIACA